MVRGGVTPIAGRKPRSAHVSLSPSAFSDPLNLRFRIARPAVAAALVAALSFGAMPAAQAQDAPAAGATAAAPGAEAGAATGAVAVRGFRSARFGMTPDEVRAAMIADFGLSDEEIVEGMNTVERTRVLSAIVPDVLPDGGAAQVSYVFGYRSGTLIQAGILWSAATDPAITPDMLAANGDVLRAFFAAQGYPPEAVATDVVLETGLLLFRGADAEGRTVILLQQGSFADGVTGQLPLTPSSLTLLYALDPENPDILTLNQGDF